MTEYEVSAEDIARHETSPWPPEGALPVNWDEPTPYEIVALMIRAMSEAWGCNVTPTQQDHAIMVVNVQLIQNGVFAFTPELVKAVALGEAMNIPQRMQNGHHFNLLNKALDRIYEEHAG